MLKQRIVLENNSGDNMDLKKKIGQNIQKYRKLQNFTQEKLAEIIGIDTTSISAIERGKYFPSAENLVKLSNALNLNISDLFTFDNLNSAEQTYDDIIKLLQLFKKDTVRLNAIKSFLRTLV